MPIDQTAYDDLSSRAASVLGNEAISELLPEQQNLLDEMLDELLERHQGDPEAPSDPEIQGIYQMVVKHILPRSLIEHYQKHSE